MSEESDQMMILLQELAALKKEAETAGDTRISKNRRTEIRTQIKQLAARKEKSLNSEFVRGLCAIWVKPGTRQCLPIRSAQQSRLRFLAQHCFHGHTEDSVERGASTDQQHGNNVHKLDL